MRILLWAPYGAGNHYWGPGISAYRLYNQPLSSDHDIFLAHGYKNQKSHNLFKEVFFISNLTHNPISQFEFLVKSYFWIKKNHKKFDVVHCLGIFEISFRPAFWFERFNIPAYCKITGDFQGISKHSFVSKIFGISRLRKRHLNRISGYISISSSIYQNLRRLNISEDKIFSIPNGVNIEKFKPSDHRGKISLRSKYLLDNKVTILFVGGLSQRKQPMWLLHAFYSLIEDGFDNIQLVFLGPDRSGGVVIGELIEFVRKFNLESTVKFFDHSSEPHEFYQLADIFCLPSKSEGMANSILEAMACQLPVIATDISGSSDLIENNYNGFIISNILELSVAIKHLILNPSDLVEFGKRSNSIIKNKFSSDIILKKHFDLFSR